MVRTIKNKPLSMSLEKQSQGKDLSFNKTLSILWKTKILATRDI